MPAARRYDDPCGTARALDVIGERWALLTVRELLFGPKRFGQLREGLRGISPNVLSQRLRELEQAGVVRRESLPPPAGVAVYGLTTRGRALEPILIELGRWGSQEPLPPGTELSIDALLLAFKTTFVPSARTGEYALHVGGEWFTVTITGADVETTRGRPVHPTTTIETDVPTLRAYAFGRCSLAEAESTGRFAITGSRVAARAFPRSFAAPSTRS